MLSPRSSSQVMRNLPRKEIAKVKVMTQKLEVMAFFSVVFVKIVIQIVKN